MATLYELQTIYSYDDALDMYEIIAVNNYNESVMLNATGKGQQRATEPFSARLAQTGR